MPGPLAAPLGTITETEKGYLSGSIFTAPFKLFICSAIFTRLTERSVPSLPAVGAQTSCFSSFGSYTVNVSFQLSVPEQATLPRVVATP